MLAWSGIYHAFCGSTVAGGPPPQGDPLAGAGRELTDHLRELECDGRDSPGDHDDERVPRADAGDHRHDARIRTAATLAQGGSTTVDSAGAAPGLTQDRL